MLQDALEQEVKALKELVEVAHTVVSTLDLTTVLQAILTSAMRFAETPAGSLALYDETTKELTLHVNEGLSADFMKSDRWEVVRGGLTEHVLATQEIVFVEDTDNSSFAFNPVAIREGIHSVICIPLVLHRSVLGTVHLADFKPRRFDVEKMNLLPIFASFAAMAIANATAYSRTRVMAITDGLTGLYNHRHFHHILSQEVERAERYDKPLTLMMMDVDNFKSFNDRYGHSVGDRVLARVGELISSSLRSVDYAFRYGGEEFAVILPETRLQKGVPAAERLRQLIEKEGVGGLSVLTPVTVSIGVVCFPTHGSTAEKLLDTVDALMYDAKVTGKNRVMKAIAAV